MKKEKNSKKKDPTKTTLGDKNASLFATTEKEILQYWRKNKIFQKSMEIETNKIGKNQYIFYDGPPFANGLPHYGHLLTGFAKDLFGRYHTMLGQKTERRFGWDCHGLPAEMGVEKELGIGGRVAIKKYSIEKFNTCCRKSVLKYTNEWEEYVYKQARWANFENNYKTMDLSYMESTIWAFKTLYNKGLLYEDYKVMPYSWKCQTPLSNFETHLDNSYRQKKSKSVYVKLRIKNPNEALTKNWPNVKNFFAVIWTTTPWTLPSNLALAVNSDIEYTVIEKDGAGYIVAKELSQKLIEVMPTLA
ncbi:MAG: class I tRNA ligase family protein [Alphaproteobacteria bacterium]|nr:class I tRNA ligase family protein [Rickettsiales bacterium]